jgi:hypothetical protein
MIVPRGAAITVLAGIAIAACAAPPADDLRPADRVVVERVPEGGLVAQAVADASGVVHIVYVTGDPTAGDVHYVRRGTDGRYSEPIRVNHRPGLAVAAGSIRGPQIAIGRAGRIHIVWNGSDAPHSPAHAGMPFYYARSNDAGGGFEDARNVVTWATGVDGGGAVAADDSGRVFVVWHANPGGGPDAGRTVFLARSDDDGMTLGREERVSPAELGACGCCGMRALVDRTGALLVAYRAAGDNIHRDMTLLTSTDEGATFRAQRLDPWEIEACPLSTVAMAEGSNGVTAVWETQGRVRMAGVRPVDGEIVEPGPPSDGGRKHPAIAYNANGERLVAWLDGTGWARGGSVAWQHYERAGAATTTAGVLPGVPSWGLAAVAALPDGRFLLLY